VLAVFLRTIPFELFFLGATKVVFIFDPQVLFFIFFRSYEQWGKGNGQQAIGNGVLGII